MRQTYNKTRVRMVGSNGNGNANARLGSVTYDPTAPVGMQWSIPVGGSGESTTYGIIPVTEPVFIDEYVEALEAEWQREKEHKAINDASDAKSFWEITKEGWLFLEDKPITAINEAWDAATGSDEAGFKFMKDIDAYKDRSALELLKGPNLVNLTSEILDYSWQFDLFLAAAGIIALKILLR